MINSINLIIFFQIVLNGLFFYNFDRISLLLKIYDLPNIRKIHKQPVPPLGGLLFFLNFMYIYLVSEIFNLNIFYFDEKFLIFSSLVFFLGIIDDKKNLKPSIKFSLLSLIIIFYLIYENKFLINYLYLDFLNYEISFNFYQSLFFTLFCILLFINASNLFDGMNFQFSIYTLSFFTYLIYKNIELENLKFLYLPLIFFVYLNFKNKCFLGDSGTLFISFFISFIVINEHNIFGNLSISEILLLMIIPGVDMLRLFVQRIFNKKSPFLGDRNHLHHILLKKLGLFKANFILAILNILPLTLFNLFSEYFILIFSLLILVYFYIFRLYKNI